MKYKVKFYYPQFFHNLSIGFIGIVNTFLRGFQGVIHMFSLNLLGFTNSLITPS